MSTSKYIALITQLCTIANISTQQAHAPMANFIIDDVGFTVIEAGHNREEAATLFCDFGMPPSKQREKILAQLLYMNLAMQGINTPAFAMHPDTGHVVLTRRIVIDNLSADGVINLMAEHAAHAMQWREHQFLETPQKSSSAQVSRVRSSHAEK